MYFWRAIDIFCDGNKIGPQFRVQWTPAYSGFCTGGVTKHNSKLFIKTVDLKYLKEKQTGKPSIHPSIHPLWQCKEIMNAEKVYFPIGVIGKYTFSFSIQL